MNDAPPRAGRRWPFLVIGALLIAPFLVPLALGGPRMAMEFLTEGLPGDLAGDSPGHVLLLAWILVLPASGIALLVLGSRRRRA